MAVQVADDIRKRILSGEIPEGVQLRQEQLAAEFGISKVPVREALHQLEAEGFVTQQFHRGAVVAGLSPGEVLEIFQLRAQIEIWLVELGMNAATVEDIEEARKLAQSIGLVEDPAQLPDINWEFHQALYKPSGKAFTIEHLRKLYSQIERYVRLQYSFGQTKEAVVIEHLELLSLYERKDVSIKDHLKEHILGQAVKLTEKLREIAEKRSKG